jgi:hypothetical protein
VADIGDLDIQRRALLYADSKLLAMPSDLPFDGGDDGSVWFTDNKTVVKSFRNSVNYTHELICYQRLQSGGIGRRIREFNVPELVDYSDDLMVIEMTAVFPPYILDFGKAYLSDPRFPDHVLEEWHERMQFWWDDRVREVRTALATLRRCGIWYFDAKPGNVTLLDWNPDIDGDDEC